jgi:PEP-CTERM motif
MKKVLLLCSLVALLSVTSFAGTVTTLYANNATGGSPYIYQINATTGAIMNTFTNLQAINGRGVIDVGNILYYTDATDGNVYKYDLSTQTQLGVAFNVAGASALASITYDGTDFWIGDYSGSNRAFLYTPTGTLLKTITLGNCTGFCDGLTFFKQGGSGFLLSNRFDGGFGGPNAYDVYDTNGNLITPALFTSTSSASTGVAWDGTSFWTSNIFDGTITQWSMSGVQMGTETLTGFPPGFNPLVEGMSFNFQQTVGSPEPGTLVMFGSGVLGLAGLLRRKFNV